MILKPTGEDSNERNNNLFAPYPNISSRNLLIGDETSNQETDDIRAFLRSEEVKGRLTAVSTASSSINRLNFNLHKESSKYKLNFKGKTKKNKIRAISFEFTLISKRSISSIPKRGNELWEQLMTQNLLLQKITFNNDGENYVNNQVVATFPCLIETGWQCFKAKNTSDLEEMPFEPEKSLIEWAKNADDKDLLQRPSIDLALEDVTDTGGVFKQVISIFWNKTILHYGQWPQWLNKFHIQYLIDEKIEHEKILKECNPIFYKLVRQLKKKKSNFNDLLHSWMNNCDINIDHIKTLNNNEAASYVAKYEVITIRKNALDDFKLGFNKFNIINELKNYKYHNIVRELYYKITYNIVIDQFDSEYIELQAQSHNKPQYRLLYEEFKELLRSMDEEELNNVMKFAIGSSIIPALPKIKISWVKLNTDEVKLWHNRLPHASTCGNLLTFCENYEISPQGFNTFKEDLRSGFINHEGFSEPVYSRNYNSNFILQNEINNELEFSSSQLNNTATGTLVQPTSNINSGNSVENAIPVDALELSTDSYQNVNSNIPNVRQMVTFRWVNVTNPLERRTRRESAEF
ncbi:hypothetical protein GLOIN_2v1824248 [Rhizophagus irregularis DAOM 181602=DAOM 197198]|nr:hypothetical protein GLOIN_2v1824248 [Rhizophagus irregularis DAOM 181602=DAOM 197198]